MTFATHDSSSTVVSKLYFPLPCAVTTGAPAADVVRQMATLMRLAIDLIVTVIIVIGLTNLSLA